MISRENIVRFLSHKWITPATIAAFFVLIITVIGLFIPPYIGMADNGDYFRILYSNGLYFSDPNYDSKYLGYFVKNYGMFQYFNENGATLFSSQSIFIKLSMWINGLFYSTEHFDIRFQAAIYTILYVGGVYLLVEALTWRLRDKYGYIISAIAIFIFGDSAYTAFFNSFYSESVVFISLIYLFASMLLLYRQRYNQYGLIIIFTISALLLTTSKQQNAPVGVIIVAAAIFLIFLNRKTLFRMLTMVSLSAILFAGVGSYLAISDEFENINKFHAMTRGVMLNATDPEAALETFGIDKQYAVLSGDIYYLPYTTIDVNSNVLIDNFYSKYGFVGILIYYVTHPDQAMEMLNLSSKNGFTIRPEAMGNYELSAGKEFAEKTSFFSGYSWLKDRLAPKTFGFVVIWIFVVIGLFAPSFVAAVKARDKYGMIRLPLMITMMLIGLSAMAVSIVGAGDADLSKHQFLFTAVFDVVTLAGIASIVETKLKKEPAQEMTT